jgi:uncharacterized protein related to proFAR isomerase
VLILKVLVFRVPMQMMLISRVLRMALLIIDITNIGTTAVNANVAQVFGSAVQAQVPCGGCT